MCSYFTIQLCILCRLTLGDIYQQAHVEPCDLRHFESFETRWILVFYIQQLLQNALYGENKLFLVSLSVVQVPTITIAINYIRFTTLDRLLTKLHSVKLSISRLSFEIVVSLINLNHFPFLQMTLYCRCFDANNIHATCHKLSEISKSSTWDRIKEISKNPWILLWSGNLGYCRQLC